MKLVDSLPMAVLERAITPEHCTALIQLAEFGMSHGGGNGRSKGS